MTDFISFPKIARYSRECIVTEKIDGTNAQIYITEDGDFKVGSRNRWITPVNDNHGFARWAYEHKDELMELGPGRHYGEWWGRKIQRGYGLTERRFSLFNVSRWLENPLKPGCCLVVPVLWRGGFDELPLKNIMEDLLNFGSYAAAGFLRPEGVVVYHVHGNVAFKKTFENDSTGKNFI